MIIKEQGDQKDVQRKQYHLLLLSDILLCTREHKQQLKIRKIISLSDIMQILQGTFDATHETIIISTCGLSLGLVFEDPNDRSKWFSELTNAHTVAKKILPANLRQSEDTVSTVQLNVPQISVDDGTCSSPSSPKEEHRFKRSRSSSMLSAIFG